MGLVFVDWLRCWIDSGYTMTEDTYTNRLFAKSIDEIRDLHAQGKSIEEIALEVNLSTYLVKALVERFVVKWDHYNDLPSTESYKE